MATSAIKSIQKLAEQHRVRYPSRLKQEPCGPTALEGLSSHWHDIGTSINLPSEKLSQIEEEFVGDDRRLFEVISHCISANNDWDTIKDAVSKLNNLRYIEIIKVYEKEFQRIPVQPGCHYKQVLPKYDTCYEEWWLDRVEFESFPLRYTKVHENDLNDIFAAIVEHCQAKWYEIGLMLGISKGLLDAIDLDMPNASRKLCEMLAKWIYNTKNCTWRDLIYVLEKLQFIQENADIPPLGEVHRNQNLNDKFREWICQKEVNSRKKGSTVQKVLEILKVRDVSEQDLIDGMDRYIKNAKLNMDQVEDLVRLIESLEGCMKENSDILKKWADKLKQDLKTAREVQAMLFTRRQKLELLQSSLEIRREKINAEFSGMGIPVSQELRTERLYTEIKLGYVKDEIKASEKAIEWANADYKAISDKLNICLDDLQKCVAEYENLLEALHSLYVFKRQRWWEVVVETLYSLVPEQLRLRFRDKYKTIIDSCIQELEDNKREIEAIQVVLNKPRLFYGSI